MWQQLLDNYEDELRHDNIEGLYKKVIAVEPYNITIYTALLEEAGVKVLDKLHILPSGLYNNNTQIYNPHFVIDELDLDKYNEVGYASVSLISVDKLYMTCTEDDLSGVVNSSNVNKLYVKEGTTCWNDKAKHCHFGEVHLPSTLKCISGDVIPAPGYGNGSIARVLFANMSKDEFSKVKITAPKYSKNRRTPLDFYDRVICTDGKYTPEEIDFILRKKTYK